VPTILCTSLDRANLLRLKDIVVTDVIDIDCRWKDHLLGLKAIESTVDTAAISQQIRMGLPHPLLASTLASAFEVSPPITTVRGLARRAGLPETRLRRLYLSIRRRTGLSVTDILHAAALARVTNRRTRGVSLRQACTLSSIDYRTALSFANKSGTSLAEITKSSVNYRRWLSDFVLVPLIQTGLRM
jgi:hypothetical protein